MREAALEFLACPEHGALLALAARARDGDHVMSGDLSCAAASCRFAVADGVPRLVSGAVAEVSRETAGRFDTQWRHFRDLDPRYVRQLLDWIAPVAPEDFAGRVVLEGGCGKGRHSVAAAGFGPRALVSLDLGESALVAFEHTRHLPNVHVAMGDLLAPPVRPVFDLALSVGVIHHLPDPAAGFRSLAARVRPGGRVVAWVYGLENNRWITTIVDPLRTRLTARLPPAVLRALCLPPAAALWGAIASLYPDDPEGSRLPYAGYFASLRGFPLREIHNIVYDQLVTPVAHYLPREEVSRWVATGFDDVTLRWKGRYSWTVAARVAAGVASAPA